MSRHVVAPLSALPPGTRKRVVVNGRAIVVFNIAGELFGLYARCPHQGGDLAEGLLTSLVTSPEPGQYRVARRGEILRCPWHGWEFDVRTGRSYCDPQRVRTRTVPVEIEAGVLVTEGLHIAETVPISVEAELVVVDV